MTRDQQRPRVVFQRSASEVERARREVAAACRGLSQDTVATAQLLACELFANALDHGAGDITMEVSRRPGELRIDVCDQSPQKPRVRTVTVTDVRGRGMMILEALALRWGVDARPDCAGKSVWFVLRTAE